MKLFCNMCGKEESVYTIYTEKRLWGNWNRLPVENTIIPTQLICKECWERIKKQKAEELKEQIKQKKEEEEDLLKWFRF